FQDKQIDLFNFKHLWTFLVAAPLSAGLSSLGMILYLWFKGAILTHALGSAFLAQTTGNLMGIILITPAFMLIFAPCVERALAKLAGEQWLPNTAETGWQVQAALLLLGAIFCSIVSVTVADRFVLLCLISGPLVAAALKYANAGVALMLLAFGCLASGASAYGAGFGETLGIQAGVTLAAANALMLGSSV